MKLVTDEVSCLSFRRSANDPTKQHKNLVFVVPDYGGSWESGRTPEEVLLLYNALDISLSKRKIPAEYHSKRLYVLPDMYRVPVSEGSSSVCIRMKFVSWQDLEKSRSREAKLKKEMKQSFSALFDELLASSSQEKRVLFLQVPRLPCDPKVRTLYRKAYAAALREAIDEVVARVCTQSTGFGPGEMSIFEQYLGISCIYVCDMSPDPMAMLEKLVQEVSRIAAICSTIISSASVREKRSDKSKALS